MPKPRDLLYAAIGLVALPFLLHVIGLGVTSATEVVIFAMACMALNILVGHTGLVSFGHGAWFGLAAYAAAIAQRELFSGAFLLPVALGVGCVLLLSWVFGFLILRRRGVYFSLLTLALSALTFAIAFRWTAFTGGVPWPADGTWTGRGTASLDYAGAGGWAPRRPATCAPRRFPAWSAASTLRLFSHSTMNAASKASPAPVVSTTFTGLAAACHAAPFA